MELFSYLFPFLLIFSIFFFLLKKLKIFEKKLNFLLSFIFSILIVFYNPLNINWIEIFSILYTKALFWVIAVAFFVLFSLMISGVRGSQTTAFDLIFGLVLVSLLLFSTGLLQYLLPQNLILIEMGEIHPFFLLLLIFALIFIFLKLLT